MWAEFYTSVLYAIVLTWSSFCFFISFWSLLVESCEDDSKWCWYDAELKVITTRARRGDNGDSDDGDSGDSGETSPDDAVVVVSEWRRLLSFVAISRYGSDFSVQTLSLDDEMACNSARCCCSLCGWYLRDPNVSFVPPSPPQKYDNDRIKRI